jgi:hypothetical protein
MPEAFILASRSLPPDTSTRIWDRFVSLRIQLISQATVVWVCLQAAAVLITGSQWWSRPLRGVSRPGLGGDFGVAMGDLVAVTEEFGD